MRSAFNWGNFDKEFLEMILNHPKTPKRKRPQWVLSDKESFIPYLDDICPYPDRQFVYKYRSVIEDGFLAGSTHLVNICRALERRNYQGIKSGMMEDMLNNLKARRMVNSLQYLYVKELLAEGRMLNQATEADSFFKVTKTIDLSTTSASEISLQDFQKDAINALQNHYLHNNKRAGFLVMPTGSGKTRTAVCFLLSNMIKDGYQVVWLAHRSMLIDQAADAFYTFSGLVKKAAPHKPTLKIICLSGEHANIRQASSDQDIIIASVPSIHRNLDFLDAILSEKVIVVIDEAHHALAPSYRSIITKIYRHRSNAKLLGLTATPVRLSDQGTINLNKLFDDSIIYQISLSRLLKTDVLAEPKFESVQTNFDIEAQIDIEEEKYIRKWGELPQATVDYLSRLCERNDLIVDTYCSGMSRYGKTLVFSMNVHHCHSLCDAFAAKGIRCDYIYSLDSGNAEKIERFRKGELDVLVNINILTEGSDIPDIQTVFLTRPTTSDVLLMQMIGRALRGASFGGTKVAYIVDFCDKWSKFTRWLNPQFVFGEEDDIPEPKKGKTEKQQLLPWQMFRDIISGITYQYHGSADIFGTLPVGWYDVTDQEGNDTNVLVFNEQIEGYTAMAKDMRFLNSNMSGDDVQREYFYHFGLLPDPNDLELLVNQTRVEQRMPQFYLFEQRHLVDASEIAGRLKKEDASLSKIKDTIHQTFMAHHDLITSIYGTEDAFRSRVFQFIEIERGDISIYGEVEEVPLSFADYDPTPVYDVLELQRQVIHECFGGVFPKVPHIAWTPQPRHTYFGQYNADYDRILINSLLNSKSVPVEVVKYVIYHEMLHQEIQKHNGAFREKEHKYHDFAKCDHFLDEKFHQFDLESAL